MQNVHACPLEGGRRSKLGQNWSMQLLNDPYVQFLNFACFIVLTSSLNAPKEGDTWGINYMSFDLAEDNTRGHVINCKAFVVYTSTLFFSKIFIHPSSCFFLLHDLYVYYYMMLQMSNLTLQQQIVDCRLQTAILSQNSRTQAEPKSKIECYISSSPGQPDDRSRADLVRKKSGDFHFKLLGSGFS